MQVCAVLTSHNRKQQTLACLDSLEEAAKFAGFACTAVLVDDGSADGTAEAVGQRHAWVTVIRADGSLYWCRGMHRAQQAAMAQPFDVLLWLNDDTLLSVEALQLLEETQRQATRATGRTAVVVGATFDQPGGHLTYAGLVSRNRRQRFNFQRVWSPDSWVECEAMNGNIVWIPRATLLDVGEPDPVFEHALGDVDYGLRIRKAGYALVVAPGVAGYCQANSTQGGFKDLTQPIAVRWGKMLSRKGLPPRSWWHFTRRHAGWMAPVYFVYPYFKVLLGRA